MCKERVKKYVKAIAWFSVLWGIKEFFLEPMVNNSKDRGKQNAKYTTTKEKLSGRQRNQGR